MENTKQLICQGTVSHWQQHKSLHLIFKYINMVRVRETLVQVEKCSQRCLSHNRWSL